MHLSAAGENMLLPLFTPTPRPWGGPWPGRRKGAVLEANALFGLQRQKKILPRPEELINHFGRRPEMRRGALLVPLGAPLFLFVCTGQYYFLSALSFFLSVQTKKIRAPSELIQLSGQLTDSGVVSARPGPSGDPKTYQKCGIT